MDRSQAKTLLRQHQLRVTTPRLEVFLALAHCDHPVSHSELLEGLGEVDWDQATVYRNLVKLSEVGLARIVSHAEGVSRYELEL